MTSDRQPYYSPDREDLPPCKYKKYPRILYKYLYGHTHIARVWINRVRLPTLHVVSETGKINISLSAFVPEKLVSRDGFGSPVPRRPAHLHTQAESGAYGIPPQFRGGVHLFILNRHSSSGQSRVYRATQLRTDGVHCRESAGTGSVNLTAQGQLTSRHRVS